jgi:Tripartite tricarboxylate transporter TctB family
LKSITANIIGCIFFLLIGIWFLVNSLFLTGTQDPMDVGPAAFPIVSSVGIIICSVFYLIREVRKKKEKNDEKITISNKNQVYLSMLVLVGYIAFMEFVGFYISSVIFLPLFLYIVGVRKISQSAFVSGGFILFAYVAFDLLLEVPMP